MDTIKTIEYKGYEIKIYQDEMPISPRENDNLGTMLCKHRDYDLGDVKESKDMSPEDIIEYVKHKDVIALPLYLLDHSGLWMRTGKYECDPGGWDTSMVGYITVTLDKVKKEYGNGKPLKRITKKVREKAISLLENEVKEYSDYLEGNVYGFEIECNGEHIDSCWGFYPEHKDSCYGYSYGGNFEKELGYMIKECEGIIDYQIKKDEEEAHIEQNVTSA